MTNCIFIANATSDSYVFRIIGSILDVKGIFVLFSGPLSRSPCELLPVGVGHPVQAMLKSFTVLSGCASRGTTSHPQEVHIINLRRGNAQGEDKPAEVSFLHKVYTLCTKLYYVNPTAFL